MDWRFFRAYENCQFQAVAAFLHSRTVGERKAKLEVKNASTEEMFFLEIKKEILTLAMLLLERNKELTYESFELMALAVLKKRKENKQNIYLEELTENGLARKINILMKVEAVLKQLFEMLEPTDFENKFKGFSRHKVKLNNVARNVRNFNFKLGARYSFKYFYLYQVDVEMIVENSGQYDIIKITTDDSDSYHYDFDLSLTKVATDQKFVELKKNNFIIYNVKTLKREKIHYSRIRSHELIVELFTRLFLLDTNSISRNYGSHCKDCAQQYVCLLGLIPEKERQLYRTMKSAKGYLEKDPKLAEYLIEQIRTKTITWLKRLKK